MAASAYPSATTGAIGTILRGIQQDQNNSPLATPPSAQPQSPVRNLVQSPLAALEAPNSSHVVAVRPDLSPDLPGSPVAPNAMPANAPIPAGVVAPGGSMPAPGVPSGVVGPRPYAPPAPAAPSPGPSGPGPSGPGPAAAPTNPGSTPGGRSVSLATSLQPSSAPRQFAPRQSAFGSLISLGQKLNPFNSLNGIA